ncbi:Adhesion G-protein coupled receptor G2 [Dissostichus eleginoides]|uniref:Adhesion G-protein coupled receptor G2 n=1 Tax=Dissostichus eleginoides TaxID=100907 RepID=A0AAD9BDN5_DISEL|nr:Adhesion G-protein coupled receptor G2 [Dissostichus eleginoides]
MEDKKRKKDDKRKREASQKVTEQKNKVPDLTKPAVVQSPATQSRSASPSPGPAPLPPHPQPPPWALAALPPRHRAATMPSAWRWPTDSPPPTPFLPPPLAAPALLETAAARVAEAELQRLNSSSKRATCREKCRRDFAASRTIKCY